MNEKDTRDALYALRDQTYRLLQDMDPDASEMFGVELGEVYATLNALLDPEEKAPLPWVTCKHCNHTLVEAEPQERIQAFLKTKGKVYQDYTGLLICSSRTPLALHEPKEVV